MGFGADIAVLIWLIVPLEEVKAAFCPVVPVNVRMVSDPDGSLDILAKS
ncbi:hypothetical protein ACFZBU_06405 [Embleya sp. NPDC008237]